MPVGVGSHGSMDVLLRSICMQVRREVRVMSFRGFRMGEKQGIDWLLSELGSGFGGRAVWTRSIEILRLRMTSVGLDE